MHMFCCQCQETSARGCTMGGTCGKSEETANYQDLLIYCLRGIGLLAQRDKLPEALEQEACELVFHALYATVTNTNFDAARIIELVGQAQAMKRRLQAALTERIGTMEVKKLPEAALWQGATPQELHKKAYNVGVLETKDEDLRSLREMVTFGLKGISAYAHHAAELHQYRPQLGRFVCQALAAVETETSADKMLSLVLETGRHTIMAMEILDRAHAAAFGEPQVVQVNIGVRSRPGILVSGHNLKELHELLQQTVASGIDVYTHGEMVSAHYYPLLRQFPHLAGNYGNSWWRQDIEFKQFNGPILVTSNCIIPVPDSYRQRIFTSGVAGFPGVAHVRAVRADGQTDFSPIIALAQSSPAPTAIDQGNAPGGFTHGQLSARSEEIIKLVSAGKIRRFVVMAGCDGRDVRRSYYKEVAQALPPDTIILTAGCAKYVYWKLPLGDIAGIPRILEAGQCNDCYSLIAFAGKLAKRLGTDDLNALPISYDIAWYDQKAVAILFALLHLGIKGIRLGPSLPAFVSPHILEKLVQGYDLKLIGKPADDVKAMLSGH